MEFNNGKYELNIRGETLCQKDLLSCGIISHKNSHCLSPFSTRHGRKYVGGSKTMNTMT